MLSLIVIQPFKCWLLCGQCVSSVCSDPLCDLPKLLGLLRSLATLSHPKDHTRSISWSIYGPFLVHLVVHSWCILWSVPGLVSLPGFLACQSFLMTPGMQSVPQTSSTIHFSVVTWPYKAINWVTGDIDSISPPLSWLPNCLMPFTTLTVTWQYD